MAPNNSQKLASEHGSEEEEYEEEEQYKADIGGIWEDERLWPDSKERRVHMNIGRTEERGAA